tara:strand:+ start:1254 stop:1610 length:357 start_codon:yes stop_codon:yes gene_type:complete
MATFTKAHLSGAADGLAVKVAATSSTGTTIHTAVSGTTAGSFSEVFLWATNTSTAAVQLTIEWGTTTAADGNIIVTVPPKEGLMAVVPGLILHNSKVVTAFAAQADVILLVGYANEIA